VPFDAVLSVQAIDRQHAERATKIWEDLDRYERVIADSRPEVVLECGTWHGWSAAWFAGRVESVVTVDVVPRVDPDALRDSVTYVVGDSVAPETVERALAACAGHRTMVVLDSDHAQAHVEAEIAAYSDVVSPGCYLVVEDGIVRWAPPGWPARDAGPLEAVERLLRDDPRFVLDVDVEDMYPVTMHPAGWWRRVVP